MAGEREPLRGAARAGEAGVPQPFVDALRLRRVHSRLLFSSSFFSAASAAKGCRDRSARSRGVYSRRSGWGGRSRWTRGGRSPSRCAGARRRCRGGRPPSDRGMARRRHAGRAARRLPRCGRALASPSAACPASRRAGARAALRPTLRLPAGRASSGRRGARSPAARRRSSRGSCTAPAAAGASPLPAAPRARDGPEPGALRFGARFDRQAPRPAALRRRLLDRRLLERRLFLRGLFAGRLLAGRLDRRLLGPAALPAAASPEPARRAWRVS